MRVLHFYKTYLSETVGGIEQVIFQLCESSGSWGIDNHVLTLSSDPHPPVVPFGGHVVHRARLDLQLASTGFSLSVFKQFRELAAEADVVNYHFPWPFMDLVHFLTGMNKPSVVTYHSDIIRQRVLLKLYRPLMSRFLHSVDRIVAASPNYFSTSDVLRQYREKTRVITYGLDKDGYPKPAAQRLEHWREKLGPRFFLFVGVMRYYKGLHILLDALQGTDYPVVIVGAGPLQAELYAQAAALGLRNVHFSRAGGRRGQGRPAATQLRHGLSVTLAFRGVRYLPAGGRDVRQADDLQRDRHRHQLHQYPWRDRPGRAAQPAGRVSPSDALALGASAAGGGNGQERGGPLSATVHRRRDGASLERAVP